MDAVRSIDCAIYTHLSGTDHNRDDRQQQSSRLTRTSRDRRAASLGDHPITYSQLVSDLTNTRPVPSTFLYLAYGSNLCAETFQGKRNIKPLSQINVVVPELSLTFDLAGIPYVEPCFGNCQRREPSEGTGSDVDTEDYHKDRWKKGMVGVVYEVTASDYAHIIATEGGGSGYKDVIVQCYPLADDPAIEVPLMPTTTSFNAHTLFSPHTTRSRPDPSYAQPSARYKKLITDGATEHNLPYEYREFLDGLRTFRITTMKQRFGMVLFTMLWGPLIAFLFQVLSKIFLRKDGTFPRWYARFLTSVFAACWISYDYAFKPYFGDGERTIGEGPDQEHVYQWPGCMDEKLPLYQIRSSTSLKE